MTDKTHWNNIYNKKNPHEVSWYQPTPNISLTLIESLKLSKNDSIIDIGGGASTFVDNLLKKQYEKVTVFDLSENALNHSRERLNEESDKIVWVVGDITGHKFEKKYKVWHDRAVFHFLTTPEHQKKYIERLENFLESKGYLIISTFAEDGPLKCSGLEIVRYSKEELINKMPDNLNLIQFQKETHISPAGKEQRFNYWVFQKR
ncbi:MAG: class I SAM-dependent methyltransferase [Bdellovibrionota bacterium]|nr:class I SAM-dependent methyltransferase [Bdellovibrionota bacterium]